jgi:hypothetical protein
MKWKTKISRPKELNLKKGRRVEKKGMAETEHIVVSTTKLHPLANLYCEQVGFTRKQIYSSSQRFTLIKHFHAFCSIHRGLVFFQSFGDSAELSYFFRELYQFHSEQPSVLHLILLLPGAQSAMNHTIKTTF